MSELTFEERKIKYLLETGGAMSDDEGISIESSRVNDRLVTGFYTERGEIKTEEIEMSVKTKSELGINMDEHFQKREIVLYAKILYMVLAIAFSVFVFNNPIIIWSMAVFLVICIGKVADVIRWIVNVLYLRKNHMQTCRYHSAEHMSLRAFRKHQRIPTAEEVKKEEPFDAKCGTNTASSLALSSFITLIIDSFMFYLILVKIVANINRGITIQLTLIVIFTVMAMVVVNYCTRKIVEIGFGENVLTRVMQMPFLAKPTDKEINLAIEVIKAYKEMEDRLDKVMEEHIKRKTDLLFSYGLSLDLEANTLKVKFPGEEERVFDLKKNPKIEIKRQAVISDITQKQKK